MEDAASFDNTCRQIEWYKLHTVRILIWSKLKAYFIYQGNGLSHAHC